MHFASLSGVDLGGSTGVLLELCVDGPEREAIEVVAERAGHLLEPVFRNAVDANGKFADLLQRHALRLKQLTPWGTTGLNFAGTDEFSVGDIGPQARLAVFCRAAIDLHLRLGTGRSLRPWSVIEDVRRLISGAAQEDLERLEAKARYEGKRSPKLEEELEELRGLLRRGKDFRDFLIRRAAEPSSFSTGQTRGPRRLLRRSGKTSPPQTGRRLAIWLGNRGCRLRNHQLDLSDFGDSLPAPYKVFASLVIAVVCAVVWETFLAGGIAGLFASGACGAMK